MAASIWHIPALTFVPVRPAGGNQSIHRNLSRIVGMHSRQTFPGIKTRGLMLRRGRLNSEAGVLPCADVRPGSDVEICEGVRSVLGSVNATGQRPRTRFQGGRHIRCSPVWLLRLFGPARLASLLFNRFPSPSRPRQGRLQASGRGSPNILVSFPLETPATPLCSLLTNWAEQF